jgi:hypothetical protein
MKEAICQRCNKEFLYDPWIDAGIYCSRECYKAPKKESRFEWDKATEEQKIQRIKESFEKNVVRSEHGCWEWTGSKQSNGYGRMGLSIKGRRLIPHRVSWMIHNGEIPPGLFVCHKCDNPPCCKPEHLFLGDSRANSKDKYDKNRGMLGDTHVSSKLTSHQVIEIKKLLKEDITHESIAKKFNIGRGCITAIALKRNWKHVKD